MQVGLRSKPYLGPARLCADQYLPAWEPEPLHHRTHRARVQPAFAQHARQTICHYRAHLRRETRALSTMVSESDAALLFQRLPLGLQRGSYFSSTWSDRELSLHIHCLWQGGEKSSMPYTPVSPSGAQVPVCPLSRRTKECVNVHVYRHAPIYQNIRIAVTSTRVCLMVSFDGHKRKHRKALAKKRNSTY